MISAMSVKQQTLAWLAELPDDSVAWSELHDEARLLREIAAAEADVRAGRERDVSEVKASLEAKWAERRLQSA